MSENYEGNLGGAINDLVDKCYSDSVARGWWAMPDWFNKDCGQAVFIRVVTPIKLALIHSEVSEGLEGDRKDLPDEHLPWRKSIEVELADAVIRIADLAGALKLDLGGAIIEKMTYNQRRADHDPANRAAAGGKTY